MPENVIVKLSSGRIAEVRQLGAREQLSADCCGKDLMTEFSYYRAAASLVRLDDQTFAPATSDLELDSRIDMLSASEFNDLRNAYDATFSLKAEEIEKEVELRELRAREQMFCEKIGGVDPRRTAYYRAAMAVIRVGETVLPPLQATEEKDRIQELDARINMLTGPQVDGIGSVYFTKFAPRGELLKNSSSAPSQDSSTQP